MHFCKNYITAFGKLGHWLDGWMDGWMGGWVDGWIDGWMGGWMVKPDEGLLTAIKKGLNLFCDLHQIGANLYSKLPVAPFCAKKYGAGRLGGWKGGWIDGWMVKPG